MTTRAIRPLTLALIQQNVYTGKYRPSNLTHTVVKRQTFSIHKCVKVTSTREMCTGSKICISTHPYPDTSYLF